MTLGDTDATQTAEAGAADTATETLNRRNVLTAAGVGLVAAACKPPKQKPVPTTVPKPPRTTTTIRPTSTTSTTTSSTSTSTTSTTMPSTSTTAPTTTTTTIPGGSGGSSSVDLAIDKLTYGPTPGLRSEIEGRGVANWIEDQLDPDGSSLATAEPMLSAYQTLTNNNYENRLVSNSPGDHLDEQLDHATILRARYSEAQLYEQMCDFWSNHFNVWRDHNWMNFLVNRHNETVIRPNALGNFEDLFVAAAHSPAMLTYLDNYVNDGNGDHGPNENYARELMELHSLGIINGTQAYSEADVLGVAKALSGWTLTWGEPSANRHNFQFAPWMHNLEALSLFGGGFTRPERSYGQGYDDGVALLRYLANHPSTAQHVALKLCRRFVSDDPSAELVAGTAAVFTSSGTEIVPTLRHIFASDEFAASHRAKVRRPFDAFIAAARALDVQLGNDSDSDGADAIVTTLAAMGQGLNGRPSPDGYPDHAGYWVSSEGLLQRWRLAGTVTRDLGFEEISVENAALLPDPLPPTCAQLVEALAGNVFNVAMTAGDAEAFCTAGGLSPGGSAQLISNDGNVLNQVLGLLLCHPAFHRR